MFTRKQAAELAEKQAKRDVKSAQVQVLDYEIAMTTIAQRQQTLWQLRSEMTPGRPVADEGPTYVRSYSPGASWYDEEEGKTYVQLPHRRPARERQRVQARIHRVTPWAVTAWQW